MWRMCGSQLYAICEFTCIQRVSAMSSAVPRCAVRHGSAGFRRPKAAGQLQQLANTPSATDATASALRSCSCYRVPFVSGGVPLPPLRRQHGTEKNKGLPGLCGQPVKKSRRQGKAAADSSRERGARERTHAREAEHGPDLVLASPLVTVPSPPSDSRPFFCF
jgi:hypothetical protein